MKIAPKAKAPRCEPVEQEECLPNSFHHRSTFMNNLPYHDLRLALLLFLALSAATPRSARADEADTLIRDTMQRQRVPGATIAVVQKGQVLKAQGYGLSNIELQVPAKRESVYQSASVGKQFTATAVMMLVEEGKLNLDERVHAYLPQTPASWKGTVRQLLAHTSGMPEITDATDLRRDYSDDELLKLVFKSPPDFEPGEKFKYSNTGYVILGILITKVTGEPYGDFLKRRIFEPLGMKTTRIISEADIIPNRSAGYRLVKGELKNQEWVSPTFNSTADGSLYLTVDDLIKWDAALYGEDILKTDSLQQMWTPMKTNDGQPTKYGFGWFVDSVNDHRLVHHTGRWQGFTSCIRRYVDDQLTVIVLMNLAGPEEKGQPGGNPQELAISLAEIYEPALVAKP